MTDSSDPTRPTSRRRRDPAREPAVIDATATVVETGTAQEEPEPAQPEPTGPTLAETTPETSREIPPETPPETLLETPETPLPGPDAAAEPRRHGPGFGSLAGAGLVGGLVGAGLVLAFQTWRPDAAVSDPRVGQIEQRLGALARQDSLQGLERRLGALEGAQGSVPGPLNDRLQAVQALAERALARADEAANRPLPASPAPQVAQNNAAITDLSNRVAALDTQLRDRLQAATAAGQAATNANQALERRLSEQEQRLAGLARQVAEGGSEATRAGTRVVLADRLANALRDGAPFPDVMAALARFNTEPARLQPLEPFAREGAPTAAELAQSFEPLGERILRESRPASESWTDRVARMAERIVTIKPLDQPGSGDAPGLVGRIEAALARGALADAVSAWDALPEPARRLSEEWGRQLKARAAAEAASRAITADAVAALNPSTR